MKGRQVAWLVDHLILEAEVQLGSGVGHLKGYISAEAAIDHLKFSQNVILCKKKSCVRLIFVFLKVYARSVVSLFNT